MRGTRINNQADSRKASKRNDIHTEQAETRENGQPDIKHRERITYILNMQGQEHGQLDIRDTSRTITYALRL